MTVHAQALAYPLQDLMGSMILSIRFRKVRKLSRRTALVNSVNPYSKTLCQLGLKLSLNIADCGEVDATDYSFMPDEGSRVLSQSHIPMSREISGILRIRA
jgi:hypothetical protein